MLVEITYYALKIPSGVGNSGGSGSTSSGASGSTSSGDEATGSTTIDLFKSIT